MKEYHKINTIYKRDMDFPGKSKPLMKGVWSTPYFEMLKDIKWVATEKIDGTNIRVLWDGFEVEFKGRTDKAQIPKHLLSKLKELFTYDNMAASFGKGYTENGEQMQVCLYGEGYGMKIQKGGNYIPDDTDFILFDVKVGKWWLARNNVEGIATALDINVVPVIGEFTLQEAVDFVKRGFRSTIAQNKDYDAEGLVLKPEHDLFQRNGQRIITKIKTRDFKNL